MSQPSSPSDRDLISIGEARQQARRAKATQPRLEELTQQHVDTIVDAMATAAAAAAEPLAALAVDENRVRCRRRQDTEEPVCRPHRARVHPPNEDSRRRSVPQRSTGPRDRSAIRRRGSRYPVRPTLRPRRSIRFLIAIKARCALVISPHPAAIRCISQTAELMNRAGLVAGLPDGAITWMQTVTLEGTQELMRHRDVAVILATGGMGLVRAAYSAGKPAYGVGPGNAPAYIERSADLPKAVQDIVTGKTFDNGLLCSAENSVVVDHVIADDAKREFKGRGAVFLSATECDALAKVLVTPQRLPNPALVGRAATEVATAAGITVPADTRVLIAPLAGVGRKYPLSAEKLCPVLSFYVVEDWKEGCERCIEILRYGGMGHTMSIHSRDDTIVLEFGLRKPASRIVVNTPTTLGSIGMTTGLDPAMTLGCGGYGGNITSDNISPKHLLNIKRLAYETRPAADLHISETTPTDTWPPKKPGIDPATLAQRIDLFLSTRGVIKGERAKPSVSMPPAPPTPPPPSVETPPEPQPAPVEFVCEDDVRQAIQGTRSIVIDDKTIVTPARATSQSTIACSPTPGSPRDASSATYGPPLERRDDVHHGVLSSRYLHTEGDVPAQFLEPLREQSRGWPEKPTP